MRDDSTSVLTSLFASVAVLAAASCGGGGAAHLDGGGGDGGAPGGMCPTTGTGSLTVTIDGLPAGVNAKVTVRGAGLPMPVTASQTLTALPAGLYTLTADTVTAPDPIVRSVYFVTSIPPAVCVGAAAGATAMVSYGLNPASNKLWVATSNSPLDAATQAFSSASLGAPGAATAVTTVHSGAGRRIVFDADGSLWAVGGTAGDPTVMKFRYPQLATSGAKTPDVAINIAGLDCTPGVGGIAFDPGGLLWISSPCKGVLWRLSAAQMQMSGDVSPALAIPFPNAGGIAFDDKFDLWIGTADDGHLVRFDGPAIALDGAAATPSLVLTPKTAAGGDLHPSWLAFDAAGNLWSNDFGGNVVFRFPVAELSGTVSKNIVPPEIITVGVSALLGGMAFDDGGGLWLAFGMGSFVRLAPAQLTASTDAGSPTVPERMITSTSLGYAEDLAFFPGAAGLQISSASAYP